MSYKESHLSSRLKQPYFRNGPSHRDGADVSFADIRKMFNFASVQIGKWVTREEQQLAANLFFDALCDLSDILQVSSEIISLRGTLHLAFGVGGNKYSSAHYNSTTHQLSLAKNAGGGALAHEWFHAFDHYIYTHMFATHKSSGFASEAWLNNEAVRPHPINQQLALVFKYMFLDDSGKNESDLVQASVNADKIMKMYYFAQPQEIAARAFEACVQDNPIKNAFLVKGTKQSSEAKAGLYPSGERLLVLSQAMLQYFYWLGRLVETS